MKGVTSFTILFIGMLLAVAGVIALTFADILVPFLFSVHVLKVESQAGPFSKIVNVVYVSQQDMLASITLTEDGFFIQIFCDENCRRDLVALYVNNKLLGDPVCEGYCVCFGTYEEGQGIPSSYANLRNMSNAFFYLDTDDPQGELQSFWEEFMDMDRINSIMCESVPTYLSAKAEECVEICDNFPILYADIPGTATFTLKLSRIGNSVTVAVT